MLYSEERFIEWIAFLKSIPITKEEHTEMLLSHAKRILNCIRIEHIPTLLKMLIEKFINSEFGAKKVTKDALLTIILNDLITTESDQNKFEAFQKLLFDGFIDESKFKAETT